MTPFDDQGFQFASPAMQVERAVAELRFGRPVILGDDNPDLIGCYTRVRDSLDALLAELDGLAAGHAAEARTHYLRVRDREFNPARAAWLAAGGGPESYTPALAARLIYLNRTGYNGLFRLNASGEYNVPPGRYDRPRIVDRAGLAAVSATLSDPLVTLVRARFETILETAQAGDFVYFDPPYAPLSPTANFRSYTATGFSTADQERLQAVLIALAGRGVHLLLSNSTAPTVSRLYETDAAARSAGLHAARIPARRAINSRADRRGAVDELVVSNVMPRVSPE